MSDNNEGGNEKLGLGNTNTTPTFQFRLRGKHFLLTLNEVENYDILKKALVSYSTLLYLISCKEKAPTTGHEHIHIYIRFSRDKTLWASKLFNVNIQSVKYPNKAIEYVKKDGNILDELGENKQQGGICGLTINEVKNMTNEELEDLPICYYNIVQKIKHSRVKIKVDKTNKKIKVVYIYGESGSGKSLNGIQLMKDLGIKEYDPVKHVGDFWIFTSGEGTALYDDFRDSDMKPNEFINFIDYNIHPMNVKGGGVLNEYNTIIITSIQSPYEIYKNKNEETRKQWIRRMNIYKVDENGILTKEEILNED